MPTMISLQDVGIWFVVGLATGAGWTLGAWLIGRLLK